MNNFELIIPQTLDKLGLPQIKEAFENVISLFPKFVVFNDMSLYYDIIRFLSGVRNRVTDERLTQYSKEERMKISEEYHKRMKLLDDLTEPLWGYEKEEECWGVVQVILR